MTPEQHNVLAQLVQLGLESLAAKASEALNGIEVETPPEQAPAETPEVPQE